MVQIRTPESMVHCQRVYDRYTVAGTESMDGVLNLMVYALGTKLHDFLGAISMELKLGDNLRRQYFTPYSVQCLVARLLVPGIQDIIRRGGIVTVSDPVSGTAGVLITYTEYLLEADVNPSWHMFGSCIDIDPMAADMAFTQLSLLGIVAEVVMSDTLTTQFNRVQYMPVYYFNDFGKRLSDLNRHRVILAFMRGLSDAT